MQAGFVPADMWPLKAAKFQAKASFRRCRRHTARQAAFCRFRDMHESAMHKPHPAGPVRGTLASLAKGSRRCSSQNNRRNSGSWKTVEQSSNVTATGVRSAGFRGERGYFVRFERFTRSGCGTATYLLPRLRRAAAPRRVIAPLPAFRFSRLQLIVRISSSRTSQSSICEANTACVDRHASNK
jgi:hypothetical protein